MVEISNTTFELDRKVKASLYARAGIWEYWVVNIRDSMAPHLHLDPQHGFYQTVQTFLHTFEVTVLDGRTLCLALLL